MLYKLLQTQLADTTAIEYKVTEVIQAVKNTPTEALLSDLLDKAVSFGLKVLAAIILYSIGIWLIKKVKNIIKRIFDKKETDAAISSFVQSIISIALTIILIITTIGILGIDTTSIAALLAGGGMAIGMALNGTVQNFAGGIMILIFRPFKAGDYIQAQGYEGTVSDVNIVSTKLNTVDNKCIIIPNGILSNGTINNFSLYPVRRLDWTIELEYDSPAEETKKILMDMMKNDSRILTTDKNAPADPFVALSGITQNGIQFTMRAWVNSSEYWDVKFDMNEKIYIELPKNGIRFPYAKMDVIVTHN